MPGELTQHGKLTVLDMLYGKKDVKLPVHPFEVRLLTAAGTVSNKGTEVVGNRYEPVQLVMRHAIENAGIIKIRNKRSVYWKKLDTAADIVVVGYEIWDSANNPKRFVYETFATPVTVLANESCEFPVASIVHTLD